MTNTAELHDLDTEHDWLDGLKAIDEQYDEAEASRHRWIRIGKGMLAGRRLCPANLDFRDWIDTTGYRVLDKDERADSMWFAFNEQIMMRVLRETRIGNPVWARRYIREILPEVHSRCNNVSCSEISEDVPNTNTPLNAVVLATPEPVIAPVVIPLRVAPPPALPKTGRVAKLHHHHSFHGLERGAEIAVVFSDKNLPSRLKRHVIAYGGKDIWNLVILAYDEGLLRSSNYALQGTALTLRLLFPETPVSYAKRFSMTDKKDREYIRNVIIPAAIAHRDEFLAAPHKLEEIVRRYERANHEQAAAKGRDERLVVERQKMSPLETDVILYGKRFWPIVDIADPDLKYDYAQLQAAAHFFNDALNLARAGKSADPKSCGMNIRFLSKRLSVFNRTADPHDPLRARWVKVFGLVTELTRLLEDKGFEGEIGNLMPILPRED